MADMVQLVQPGTPHAHGHHAKRDTGLLGQDFEDELVGYNFNPPFAAAAYDDVNAEDSELRQYIRHDAVEIPLSSPPALTLSTGPSPSTSYIGYPIAERPISPITPPDPTCEPRCGTRPSSESNSDVDFGFEDLIKPEAYQTGTGVPLAKTNASTASRPHRAPSPRLPCGTCNGVSAHAAHSQQPSAAVRPSLTVDSSAADQGASLVHPTRSLSKRGRTDTNGTMSGLVKQNSKRHKQVPNGFPCREGCGHVFSRSCDEKKHYGRTHAPEEEKKHSCPECNMSGKIKRFLYPKDVARHLKQVHHVQPSETPIAGSIATGDVLDHASPASSTTTSTTFPGTAGFWTLHKAVLRFKNLRISSKSPPSPDEQDDKCIMVSTGDRTFVEVDVAGVTQTDTLTHRILTALKISQGSHENHILAQVYSRRGGRTHLGAHVNMRGLLHLVSTTADSQGTLKLIINNNTARVH